MVSVNRLRTRKSKLRTRGPWMMDSGAFTTLATHGGYPYPVEEYAIQVRRFASPQLICAVAQDYMCEPFMLARTGLTVAEHQRLTVERYDALIACDVGGVYIMPVLQGYTPAEYVAHLAMYGDRLAHGAWVGVGSVCKRNVSVDEVVAVLRAIKAVRPDLQLHGFGLKITALQSPEVRALLHTSDSLAWSYSARKKGRNANCWGEALRFANKIAALIAQDVGTSHTATDVRNAETLRIGLLGDS